MTTIKQAQATAGTLSSPSKMPGKATGTPAKHCQVGSKLRDIPGSVCFGCYAFDRGAYAWAPVQKAYEFRYQLLMASKDNPEPWINAMATMIKRQTWFRWDDSGDLQGEWHLANIAEVARRTPNTRHWLPTREYRMVKGFMASDTIPDNLVVRLSAHMVDGPAPAINGLPTSTVLTTDDADCPSRFQNNECGDCRRCWDSNVKNVSYHKH